MYISIICTVCDWILNVYTGCIPLDPELSKCSDNGKNFIEHYEGSPTLHAIQKVVDRLIQIDRDLPWTVNV